MKILFLRVGLACNNRCSMCAGTWTEQPTLSTNDMVLKLKAGSVYGFDEIVISGGEPTIRNDIPEIASAARELGYKSIVLQTNGRRFTDKKFTERLLKSGVTRFLISLHGATADVHDYQTNIPGSFDQAIAGIRNINNLSGGHARIAAHSVILPNNYRSLEKIVDLLYTFRIPMLKMSYVVPVGRASGIFSNQNVPKMTDTLPYIFRAVDQFIAYYGHKPMTSISIGYIPLCLMSEYQSFSDENGAPPTFFMNDGYELENADEMMISQGLKIKRKECSYCKHYSICGGIWREYPEYFGWNEFVPQV